MKTTRTGITATALASLALGACNDSGFVLEQEGSADNAPLIEGAYGGFLSGAHIQYYRMLLAGSDLWLVYGTDSATAGFQATGFFQTTGTIDQLTHTGTTAIEYFGESAVGAGTATAVHNGSTELPLLNGSVTIAASVSNFSAGPIAGANFHYGSHALLAGLNGTWLVTDLNGASHELVVNASTGTFILDDNDPCEATGHFTPVPDRNSYEGDITFGNGCPSNVQNRTLNGVALIYANQMPAGTQLIAMFRDVASNSVGYVLNGVR